MIKIKKKLYKRLLCRILTREARVSAQKVKVKMNEVKYLKS